MSETALISVVAMLGWLVLAGSAMASFKLGWSRILQLILLWTAIFGGLFVFAYVFDLQLPSRA